MGMMCDFKILNTELIIKHEWPEFIILDGKIKIVLHLALLFLVDDSMF